MTTDNRIKLRYKQESESGLYYFDFYLSTDNYFLFDSARQALRQHGTIYSTINGVEFSEYHRDQGYRQYMVWGVLSRKADTTQFLHEVLNRSTETLIDSYGRIVGIIEKGL
jgi:hypothetical protein